MRVLDTIWFSPMGGTVGIVLTINKMGERKAYVKAVAGIDEKTDIEEIINFGAKVHTSQARAISNHLMQDDF